MLHHPDGVSLALTLNDKSVVNALYLNSKTFFLDCDGIYRQGYKSAVCANFSNYDRSVDHMDLWHVQDGWVFRDSFFNMPISRAGRKREDADAGDKNNHLDDVHARQSREQSAYR